MLYLSLALAVNTKTCNLIDFPTIECLEHVTLGGEICITSCFGLWEEEPQTAHAMSFTWVYHIATSVLIELKTLPRNCVISLYSVIEYIVSRSNLNILVYAHWLFGIMKVLSSLCVFRGSIAALKWADVNIQMSLFCTL